MAVSPTDLAAAAAILARGGVVAFPTETVYGLGADAFNADAVTRIFEIKGRRVDKPLIVHLADGSDMDAFAQDIPLEARKLAKVFWPGPLTLVLPRRPEVPDVVTAGGDTVGLRVPDHAVARAMIRALGKVRQGPAGVAAPSANKAGRAPPVTADAVRAELGNAPALILDAGECAVQTPSTVVGVRPGGKLNIIREGAVPIPDILVALMDG